MNKDNPYSKTINALITMRFNEKYTKTEKHNMFTDAAKTIGIPENEIPEHNPFFKNYIPPALFSSNIAIEYKREQIENAKISEENAKKSEELAKKLRDIAKLQVVGIQLYKENLIYKETLKYSSNFDKIPETISLIAYFKNNPLCFHWGNEQEYHKNIKWFNETIDFFKEELNITDEEIENEMKNQDKLDFRWDEKQKVYILYGKKEN